MCAAMFCFGFGYVIYACHTASCFDRLYAGSRSKSRTKQAGKRGSNRNGQVIVCHIKNTRASNTPPSFQLYAVPNSMTTLLFISQLEANCQGSVNPIQSCYTRLRLALPPPCLAIILIPFRTIYRAASTLKPLACAQRPSPATAQQIRNESSKGSEVGAKRQLRVNDSIKRNPNINYALINFIYLTDFVAYSLHFACALMAL